MESIGSIYHKIKDLIAFCRREGLIVAPDVND